jgi:hypothetical protein
MEILVAQRALIGPLLVAFALMPTPGRAECAPGGLMRIVTVNRSPGIEQRDFAAQPKILYRSGRLYGRIEESEDTANRQRRLLVASAPDAWSINLLDGTGVHMVDPDEEPRVTMPILSVEEDGDIAIPEEFLGLEFGCEMQFFAERKAELVPHAVSGRELARYQLTSGQWRLTLLTHKGDPQPQAHMLAHGGKVKFFIRYLAYQRVPELNMSLFRPPPQIKIQEQ